MATNIVYAAPDNTNFTTFSAWAKPISDFLATMGWVQQNDTGQAVWVATVLTLTQVTTAGVYSYSSFTGPSPRVGMSVIITGFATGGNNVTGTITAVTGTTSGTFTISPTTQTNETHAGSATTTVSTLPGTNAFIYEIWAPSDSYQTGSTQYFLRMDYGTAGTANIPNLKYQLGTSTNGAGTLSGTTTTAITIPTSSNQTTAVETDMSGDAGRFSMFLFRTHGTSTARTAIAIERTLNVDGTPNGDGVTIWSAGNNGSKSQTIHFPSSSSPGQVSRWAFQSAGQTTGSTEAFNNSTPLAGVFPAYGKFGNPQTVVCGIDGGDFGDGLLFTTTLYGATMTYMATNGMSIAVAPAALAIRFE